MKTKDFLLVAAVGLILWFTPKAYAADPVRVAILDSGSNIAFKEGVNFVDDSMKDFNGHGTLMANIIKDECPTAEFYIVKVIARNGVVINEDAVILGIEWAISKDVKVINMSLRIKPSPRLNAAIKKAHDRGIVLVAAAGNNDRFSESYYSAQESGSFTGQNGMSSDVAYPAKYPEVIAVGALDKHGRIYNQSVQSDRVDLYFRGYHGRKSGTSIASAYVAGTIAQMLVLRENIRDQNDLNQQERQMLDLIRSVSMRCSGAI